MPYIPRDDRCRLVQFDAALEEAVPDTAGELNYIFTVIALEYLDHKGKCYQTMNDIIGALEGAKIEFYRRIVADYEDSKIRQNGDVYDYPGE